MNVFDLRRQLIGDYARYVRSFIAIDDPRIRAHVDQSLDQGLLWPEPRIGLNPSFAEGGWIDDLVEQGILHDECARIFRIKDTPETVPGRRLRLHRHQVEAIAAARTGRDYVLTTGTGSGKSLSYIVPIVDHVLRSGPRRGRIQAIVVYPMTPWPRTTPPSSRIRSRAGSKERSACGPSPTPVASSALPPSRSVVLAAPRTSWPT